MVNTSSQETRKSRFLFAMTGAGRQSGGIATANLNILHALVELAGQSKAGLAVFSFSEKEGDRPDFLPAWVNFKPCRGNKLSYSLHLLRAAVRKPIFFFDHVSLALPLLPLAFTGTVKTVIFAHGSESWSRLRMTSMWSYQCASLCLTNSHFTLRKMRERISSFNGQACPLGLPADFVLNSEIPGNSNGTIKLDAADGIIRPLGERFILLTGRMYIPGPHTKEGQKGHRCLINVLPDLLNEFPEVQLVFPGPGDDRQNLMELARRKSVASAVFFPGFVSLDTLTLLYRNSYAFVMPSRQEGFGLVYLEAMNHGKPCVGCLDQGAEDIIVPGETGLLIRDPDESVELLGALRTLLRDQELARRLGKKGFERLHGNFTSHHFRGRFKEKIRSIL